MTTKQEVAEFFAIPVDTITQYGKKSLFSAYINGNLCLISYVTIVGKFISGKWHLTTCKYRYSTTRQLNWFAMCHYDGDIVWTDKV